MSGVDEKAFVERVRGLLVSLPYDLKVLFEVLVDQDLPPEVRKYAAGGVVYCLSPSDPIPDSAGLVGFVDDCVVVRLVLKKLLELGGDDAADYPERFPEQFEPLEDDLKLLAGYLGDSMRWMHARIEKLHLAKYKGKKVLLFVEDEEACQFLYEEGLEFTTEYEIDDDAAAKLVSGASILKAFQDRNQVEDARR